MAVPKTIQFDTSDSVLGGENIAQAIETDKEVCFNESYTVIGKKMEAPKIYATYDLSVIGDLYADNVEINGDLLVNGNIKANFLRCRRLVCTGKVNVNSLLCAENIMAKSVTVDDIQTQGSAIVLDSFDVSDTCEVERNIIAGEGISGSGQMTIENAIAGDYFDFDGAISGHYYEISTMLSDEHKKASEEENNGGVLFETFADELNDFLKRFVDGVIEMEEDDIIAQLRECAECQRISFDEIEYLFDEIARISYYNEITNLRDYLLVRYAELRFPQQFKEYETISHVFTTLLENTDVRELEYSANNLLELTMSLRIITAIYESALDEYADKIFSFIGLKYSFVNKQFTR